MRKFFLLIIYLIFISEGIQAQNTFQKIFGISIEGEAKSVCISSDSHLLISGAGSLIKTDTSGNLIWVKNYLTEGVYKNSRVFTQANGGIVMLVELIANNIGENDIMFFNMNADGLINWIRIYGTSRFDKFSDLVEMPNGDFIIAGQTNSISQADKDILLMRMNKLGSQYWQKTYGTYSEEDNAEKLLYSVFNGLIISGQLSSEASILKTDFDGNLLWNKSYGKGSLIDMVENPSNGNIIAAGYTLPPDDRANKKIFVVHTDSAGNVIWSKVIGNEHECCAKSISVNSMFTEVYISGQYQADSLAEPDAFLAVLNASNGALLHFKTYGSEEKDYFNDNVLISSNSVIHIGYSECCGIDLRTLYMVKTDRQGYSGCNENTIIPPVDSIAIISPDVFFVRSDTGEIFVLSDCCPPDYIDSYNEFTLCNSSGSMENTFLSEPFIYPNPFDDFIHVFTDGGNNKIEIYSISGQRVYTSDLSEKYAMLDLKGLSKGMYVLKIFSAQRTYVKKMIKE